MLREALLCVWLLRLQVWLELFAPLLAHSALRLLRPILAELPTWRLSLLLLLFFIFVQCLSSASALPSQTVLSSVSLASVGHNVAERWCVHARPRSEWSIKADPSKITADRPSVFHHVRFRAAVCLYFVCVCVRVRAPGGTVCAGLFSHLYNKVVVCVCVCVKTQSKRNRHYLKSAIAFYKLFTFFFFLCFRPFWAWLADCTSIYFVFFLWRMHCAEALSLLWIWM